MTTLADRPFLGCLKPALLILFAHVYFYSSHTANRLPGIIVDLNFSLFLHALYMVEIGNDTKLMCSFKIEILVCRI